MVDGVALTRASLTPRTVPVEPGGEAGCTLTVRNLSPSVQRIALEVCGDAAGWTHLEPDGVSLLGGQAREVAIRFRPPRAPAPPAGDVPFAIKATPRDSPDDTVVMEGDIVVGAFVAPTAAIEPRTSRGLRRARPVVRVHNGGNTPLTAELSARSAEPEMVVSVDPPELTLEPGYVGSARVTVALPRRSRLEPPALPFQVTVRTDGASLTLDGGVRRRRFPFRVLVGVVAAVAGLVAGGVFFANRQAKVRDAIVAVGPPPTTSAPTPTAAPPETTLPPATTAPTSQSGSGEAAAIALGARCRTTTDLRTNGAVLSSPDGAFVRQFADDATARDARDLLARHGMVCVIGDAARGDSVLTFHPPPVDAGERLRGSRCTATYEPAGVTKEKASQSFAVVIGRNQALLYETEADRDRAFALVQGHDQICWLGGGDEDLFSNFFDWSTAVTYF